MKDITQYLEVRRLSDKYIDFVFKDEYKSFAGRLAKWRELNNLSKVDMANLIYEYRWKFGVEDYDISDVDISDVSLPEGTMRPVDYEIDLKREKKKEQRINSLKKTYASFEKEDGSFSNNNSAFSIINLRCLKNILNCDYEFLFGEIDTLHRNTQEFSKKTGLNLYSVEQLTILERILLKNKTNDIYSPLVESNEHRITLPEAMLVSLNLILSDDDLMSYLSYFLTNINDLGKNSDLIINRPTSGLDSEDAFLDSDEDILDPEMQLEIYIYTIANKLSKLQEECNVNTVFIPTYKIESPIELCSSEDAFGTRLKKWRQSMNYTQQQVCDLIINYQIENNIESEPKTPTAEQRLQDRVLRSYQNWESKNNISDDIRMFIPQLQMLRNIMKCDYEYLFGEINSLKVPADSFHYNFGLTQDNINKLASLRDNNTDVPDYAANILESIDIIIKDSLLWEYLAYYLTDLSYDTTVENTDILKPIKIIGYKDDISRIDYRQYLFPQDGELRNVFLLPIRKRLLAIRKQHYLNQHLLTEE